MYIRGVGHSNELLNISTSEITPFSEIVIEPEEVKQKIVPRQHGQWGRPFLTTKKILEFQNSTTYLK